jgi:hypothetical protein
MYTVKLVHKQYELHVGMGELVKQTVKQFIEVITEDFGVLRL